MKQGTLLSPGNLVRRFSPRFADHTTRAFAVIARSNVLPWPVQKRSPALGRLGHLEVRLAETASEIRRAQTLRYQVFYEEMGAIPDLRAFASKRDSDRFDPICQHLIVVDVSAKNRSRLGRESKPRIVATYRLLGQEAAERHGGFYSASEFDIAPLLARKPDLKFLELGRSCVLPAYRNKRTMELLWHGIWAYVRMHRFDAMFGCASFEGTDPETLALPLSFLHTHARASAEWDARAHDSLRVEMNRLPASAIDAKAALRSLPPLVKGYLRLGGMVGDGAIIDRQFGTTDVLIVLPVASIASRYIAYYGADAGRYAVSSVREPRAAA